MELRHLRYFVAVAEELHFGRAAERLGIAQPPLSRAIGQLERRIGARLLTRSSRAVTLTEPGSVLLREARVALDAVAAAERRTRRAALAPAGATSVDAELSVAEALALDQLLAQQEEGPLPDQRGIDLEGLVADLPELLKRHLERFIALGLEVDGHEASPVFRERISERERRDLEEVLARHLVDGQVEGEDEDEGVGAIVLAELVHHHRNQGGQYGERGGRAIQLLHGGSSLLLILLTAQRARGWALVARHRLRRAVQTLTARDAGGPLGGHRAGNHCKQYQ